MSTYIGLDLGTSAVKGVLTDAAGRVLSKGKCAVRFLKPSQNQIEIEPDSYFRNILGLIADLARVGLPDTVGAIAAAAASGNTLLTTPDQTFRSNIISWLDHRDSWMPPAEWQVHAVVGWPPLPAFPLMHLHWVRRHKPEWFDGAFVGMNNDFLNWKLCGRRAVDYSSATPFYLQDQRKFQYHASYLEALGISPASLPELVPTGTVLASLLPEFAELPGMSPATKVVAGSFDHPAAARSAGIFEPGSMLLSCGSSWVGFYPERERRVVPNKLCDPFQAPAGGCWGRMFSVPEVGCALEAWITARFGPEPDRYVQFNAAALSENGPERQRILEVIRCFKTRMGNLRPKRMVMVGGPAEGAAWPVFLERELEVSIEISPYKEAAGAVGAAMIASGACK